MICRGCPYLFWIAPEDITCSRFNLALRVPTIYTNKDRAFLMLWNMCKCEIGRKLKQEANDDKR